MTDRIVETAGDDPGFLTNCANRTGQPLRFMFECCLTLREAIRAALTQPANGTPENLRILQLHSTILDWTIEFFTNSDRSLDVDDLNAALAALREHIVSLDPALRTMAAQPEATRALRDFFESGTPGSLDRHNAFWSLLLHHEDFREMPRLRECLPVFFLNAYYMLGHGLHFLMDHWQGAALQDRLVDALRFDRNSRTTHFEIAIAGVLGCCGVRLRPRVTSRRRGQPSPDYDILVHGQDAGVLECRIREVITADPTRWLVDQVAVKAGQVATFQRPRVVALDTNTPGLGLGSLNRDEVRSALNAANANMEHLVVASTNILRLEVGQAIPEVAMILFLKETTDLFRLLMQSCRGV